MAKTPEIDLPADLGDLNGGQLTQLKDAIERARDSDRMTFLTRGIERIAAIVPVGVAVALEPSELTSDGRAQIGITAEPS